MLGITEIASYIPKNKISNIDRKEQFEADNVFITEKIGISHIAVKNKDEDTSDMAIKAFQNLEKKYNINKEDIQVIILVTQNPDKNIPHASALIHGKLDFPETCAAFDISLGCSGFVYGLSIIKSFMENNGFTQGLLFTCDPYSKIIDSNDKNTSLLFGDAASVTFISDNPKFDCGKFTFGTIGKEWFNLVCENNVLSMNGRGIFNFAARYIPRDFQNLLKENNAELENIDKFIFHQGSKYIIDTLTRKLKLEKSKVVYDIMEYGNTVSSSIPIILEKLIDVKSNKLLLICGFGVGLSWSSNILYRI